LVYRNTSQNPSELKTYQGKRIIVSRSKGIVIDYVTLRVATHLSTKET
jgi:hypothetical protein